MRRWKQLDHAERVVARAAFFDRLDARELQVVRRYVDHTERRAVRFVAIWVNRLSNGPLYPIVAVMVFFAYGQAIVVPVAVAASSVGVAHLIYPILKTHCARRRPFECDTTILSLLKPLDRHSFPSGHTMTATAAFLPISVTAAYQLVPIAIAGIVSIGWARLAAGHHYPSDVLAGAAIGCVIVAPGLFWILY